VPIDLAAVRDPGHEHEALGFVDCIDDAVVADADSVVVAASELDDPDRPRIACEAIDRRADAFLERSL
jgi:hypothetical protein